MTQPDLDRDFELSELKRQVADLKLFVDKLKSGGLDNFTEFGYLRLEGIDVRLDNEGVSALASDSGDSISESPDTNTIKWLKDNWTGTPLAEVFGGYTTPGLNVSQLVLRALSDNMDFGAVSMGIWGQTAQKWNPILRMSNVLTDANPPLMIGTIDVDAPSSTTWLTLRRVDDDNFTLWIRKGATLVQIGTGLLTDTAWAAKGDLAVGTANDTAQILSYPGVTGYFLRSDTTTTTGVQWESLYSMSNQTSNFNAAAGNLYRCSNTITATLPAASVNGTTIAFKNIGTGVVTVSRQGSDTIFTMASGQTSFTILPGEAYTLFCSAGSTEWEVF